MNSSSLPKDWRVLTLSDVCSLITDGTHKTPNYVSSGVRFISIANIKPYKPIDFRTYEKFVTQQEHESLSKRVKPRKNDILFPRIGTLGYAKRIDFDFEVSIFVGLGLARPNVRIVYPKFLEYYMNSSAVDKYSRDAANGTGRLTLPLEASRVMPVPLPPLPEQERIVARIEELFSELDKGVEALQTIKAQLRVYRQAAIGSCFEAAKPARITTLSKIADISGGITKGQRYSQDTNLISLPYLRVANVQDGYLDLQEIKEIQLRARDREKYTLHYGDVLYTEGGDRDKLGRGTIWRNQIPECVHQNHVFRARVDRKFALPEFVAYWSLTKTAKDYFYSSSKQTVNLASINKTVLSALPVPLPTIEIQAQVISQIESRLSVCDQIEKTVDESLAKAESLRQSILKKAFEGRL